MRSKSYSLLDPDIFDIFKGSIVKNILISKKPNFIIVSNYGKANYHYHVNDRNTINKTCDKGIWHIKYKTKLDN